MSITYYWIINPILIVAFCLAFVWTCYLWLLAFASIHQKPPVSKALKRARFAIAIPAHNEDTVIGNTVDQLLKQDYPRHLFDIFVVADYCEDKTAQIATEHGAICYERLDGERGSKGAALRYLFEQIFKLPANYDAVVVFDADTHVHLQFLGFMNSHIQQGKKVIQGHHIISNPREGLFPALTWCMMSIDNRFSNQGRTNLKLSAKHMGDSICFNSEILKEYGWGAGLTEDYEFRLQLLLDGIKIQYEPAAVGLGQAPRTYQEARAQRLRWAKGMAEAHKHFSQQLFLSGMQEKDWSKLDGALASSLPSYSTMTLIAGLMLALHVIFINSYRYLVVTRLGFTPFCPFYLSTVWFGS
jgi:cellulose synthase/poly-beta-1,6-N-acetylglucosamine synthase-like glycosyltransferase